MINNFHSDILRLILQLLPHFDIAIARFVCSRWRKLLPTGKLPKQARCDDYVNYLELLKWARRKGCPWSETTCVVAGRYGQVEALQWLREQGCKWNQDVLREAAKQGHSDILGWAKADWYHFDENTIAGAAASGNLDLVKWLRTMKCPWNAETCNQAIEHGQLHILQWVHDNGCPWNMKTTEAAAKIGNLPLLQNLINYKCPFYNRDIMIKATRYGHIHILDWMFAYDPVLSYHHDYICFETLRDNNVTVSVLQWLKDHDMLSGSRLYSCVNEASPYVYEILEWLRDNGIPLDLNASVQTIIVGKVLILEWLVTNGCPHDKREALNSLFIQHRYPKMKEWLIQH
jgi:F-box domain